LVNSLIPNSEHSLPNPLDLVPPLGNLESVLTGSLINTEPVSSYLATFSALSVFLLKTAPPNPYSLSLAILIASCSDLTLISEKTGPKISS
jgi:hypothetical protein